MTRFLTTISLIGFFWGIILWTRPVPTAISTAVPMAAVLLPTAQPATEAARPTQVLPTLTEEPATPQTTPAVHRRSFSTRLMKLATQTTSPTPTSWKDLPIVPTLSAHALAIYQRGLALGNNPQGFSKIGDGEASALWFLTEFELGTQYYDLGPYADLQSTIDYFAGSLGRRGQAALRGFNTTRILDASFADPATCNPGETPLDCELRIYHPSFAIISLGTNQVFQPDVLAPGLRLIVEQLIAHGVVPILATKGDNIEGDDQINTIIAGLAIEYDIPLWNFWRAIQPLPEHGLQPDFEHLTYAPNDFDNPDAMQKAWPVRNLTALQVLQAMQLAVTAK